MKIPRQSSSQCGKEPRRNTRVAGSRMRLRKKGGREGEGKIQRASQTQKDIWSQSSVACSIPTFSPVCYYSQRVPIQDLGWHRGTDAGIAGYCAISCLSHHTGLLLLWMLWLHGRWRWEARWEGKGKSKGLEKKGRLPEKSVSMEPIFKMGYWEYS